MVPIGFKSYQISMQGIFLTIFGVISSMFTGALINKYHRYKFLLRVYTTGCFVLFLILLGMFQTENVVLVSINLILVACCLIPIIPTSIDFSSELTYPIE